MGAAFAQIWPAFALVTGLLLIGVVAEEDRLFAAAGATLAGLRAGPRTLLVVSLALVAAVTAVLNLDTSVVFLTPVLIHLARQRGLGEAPFLYGAVFMSNAASLFLPGSNLTNLIVLHGEHVSGATYVARTWPAALAAAASTAVVLLIVFRAALRPGHGEPPERIRARPGVGLAAVVVATILVLVLTNPALPVLLTGGVAILAARPARERMAASIDVRAIGGLFVLALLLGTAGRAWDGPHAFFDSLGRWPTAGVAALAALAVNNLPAAVLVDARARAPCARAPPRPQPRPEPRRHRLAVGAPLAPHRRGRSMRARRR